MTTPGKWTARYCCLANLHFARSYWGASCPGLVICAFHVLQLQSTRVFKATYGQPSPPAAKLISIKHAALQRPSGIRFLLQVSGTCKFKARKCYGELCNTASTEMDSPALTLAGKALRVCKATDNVLGQELEVSVSTTEKLTVEIDNVNTLLAAEELCFEFRYNNSTASTRERSSFMQDMMLTVLMSHLVTCDRVLAQSEGSDCLYGSLLLHSIVSAITAACMQPLAR